MQYEEKDLIIFDLDGTLTESKSPIDRTTAKLLAGLLRHKRVAVISGAELAQFKKQLLLPLNKFRPHKENLFLFPQTGTMGYRFHGGRWTKVYANTLSVRQVKVIRDAFDIAMKNIGYVRPLKTYGPVLQNRGAQVTFSALGQGVVESLGKRGVALKSAWQKRSDVRQELRTELKKLLPEFEIHIGGLTSIDITQRGIDKAYGIREMNKTLKIPFHRMLFVGDAIFKGGNDYEALKAHVDCVRVSGPRQTEALIKRILRGV